MLQKTGISSGRVGFLWLMCDFTLPVTLPGRSYSTVAIYFLASGLVSKEIGVLRRWGSETQNVGFIN